MKKTKVGKVFVFGFILSLICLLAFSQFAEAAPKKPKSIKVVFIGDISGPYAPITGATHYGMIDALEYVNKELNGIDGVKMEGIVKDDGGRVAMGVQHYMEVREMRPKPAMVYIIVSALGEALRERLAEDKIVAMSVTGTPAIYPAKYTFGWFPLYTDLFGAYIDWLKETWNKPGAPRVAFLTWDSTYGRGPVTPECYAYAKSKGIEMVAKDKITWRRDDFWGYDVPSEIPGVELERFEPRNYYSDEQMERLSYDLKMERLEWLSKFPSLHQDILNAVKR